MDSNHRIKILELEALRQSRFMRERLKRAKSEADEELRTLHFLQGVPPIPEQLYLEAEKYEVALGDVARQFSAIRKELAASEQDLLSEPELNEWLAKGNAEMDLWLVARTEEFAGRLHAAGEILASVPAPADSALRRAAHWARDVFAEEFHEMRLSNSLGIGQAGPGHLVGDRNFSALAIEEARKSISEGDGRPRPKVGVVVVKNGRVLATAHRGESPECHAEYIALEKKLATATLAGATVYTTLEPCTTRNHPKIPCATRLSERKVARVVIGMLDPNPDIRGRGQRQLFNAGITTDLFPSDLMKEVEELNREFTRLHDGSANRNTPDPT